MTVTQETFIIGDWENLTASIRRRTTSRGTSDRVSLEIKSRAVGLDLNDTKIAEPIAKAVAAVIGRQIAAIQENASPRTIQVREYVHRAYHRITTTKARRKKDGTMSEPRQKTGSRWSNDRYGGGRIGPTPPPNPPSERLFYDSGRLAKNLATRLNSAGEYVINVPANRFNQPDAVPGWLARLRQLVQALGNPASLTAEPEVKQATLEVLKPYDTSINDATKKLLGTALGLAQDVQDLAGSAEE